MGGEGRGRRHTTGHADCHVKPPSGRGWPVTVEPRVTGGRCYCTTLQVGR
jgi:hypothetical protein